jgi:hypothetical protein
MEKQLENPGKMKKPKQPKPAHPTQRGRTPALPRRLTGGRHLSAAVSSPALSLSPSLCLVGPGCRRRFPSPAHPSSLSALRARFARHRAVAPACPLSLSRCAVGPPVSSTFPAPRRGPARAHSRTSPAHAPSSFLSTARAHTHFPIPFHIALPSLELCPRRSASPETHARRAGLLARRRSRQATPSSAPR